MSATPFQIPIAGGTIEGHTSGRGIPALFLHGGPGLHDYLEPLAAELDSVFTPIRYTQRGTAPTTVGGPYTVETHMADALAVLDAFSVERAWVVGHAWGGQLGLHLAVAHPDRLHGIVCVDSAGAYRRFSREARETLAATLDEEELARTAEIDAHLGDDTVTEDELLELLRILWPHNFAKPEQAPPCPFRNRSIECARHTSRSLDLHFKQRTLLDGLAAFDRPALFVHGLLDPIPVKAAIATARLIPGGKVAKIPAAGHYPWLERPGLVERMVRGLIAQL